MTSTQRRSSDRDMRAGIRTTVIPSWRYADTVRRRRELRRTSTCAAEASAESAVPLVEPVGCTVAPYVGAAAGRGTALLKPFTRPLPCERRVGGRTAVRSLPRGYRTRSRRRPSSIANLSRSAPLRHQLDGTACRGESADVHSPPLGASPLRPQAFPQPWKVAARPDGSSHFGAHDWLAGGRRQLTRRRRQVPRRRWSPSGGARSHGSHAGLPRPVSTFRLPPTVR